MQKIFRSRWDDVNDLSFWEVELYPNTYNHQGPKGEYIDLPPNIFVINEVDFNKVSKYNRVGLSDIPTLKLNVDLGVLNKENEGHKDFVRTIFDKESSVPSNVYSPYSAWTTGDIYPDVKRHNFIRIEKSYSVLDTEMAFPSLIFYGIQEALTGNFSLNKDIAFDITFQHAVGYALGNIDFKIAWAVSCVIVTYSNGLGGNPVFSGRYKYPFAFLYHNTITDYGFSWNGKGKNNVAGSIVYCPIPSRLVNTASQKFNYFSETAYGFRINGINEEMITFVKLADIFLVLNQIINDYLQRACGFAMPSNLPTLKSKFINRPTIIKVISAKKLVLIIIL